MPIIVLILSFVKYFFKFNNIYLKEMILTIVKYSML